MNWREGSTAIDFLLSRVRLDRISIAGVDETCQGLLDRATKRLSTAVSALDAGDLDGAFVNAYDVYRMSAETLLLRQGLRATGGDGSHVTVGDAVCAQFGGHIEDFTKARFERFRHGRHAAQYFDPRNPDSTAADARWAVETAGRTLDQTRRLIDGGTIDSYE